MKVAAITGATSWMSRATAVKLLEQDWIVVLGGKSFDKVDGIVDALTAPGRAFGSSLDVADPQSVDAFVKRVLDSHGQIDAMINIAGGLRHNSVAQVQPTRKVFVDTSSEDFDWVMRANFDGVVNTTKAVLPSMIERKSGNIVSIVSGAAFTGYPKMAAYSAAKAGVLAFSKTIAQEVGEHNIRVNCVLPGFTQSRWNPAPDHVPFNTKMSPLGRITSPHDVAAAISFLLSDAASHITGTCMDISGGVALH